MSRHPSPPSRHPAPPKKAGAAEAKHPPTPEAPKPAAPRTPSAKDLQAALAALGITKEYGDLPALAPLDLRVDPGEAVVLVGHNGSGKTTFLRMCAGLLDATGGQVLIGGQPAGSLAARRRLSYLSDTPTFYEDLSVWEHLEYTARLHGRTEWEQEAADLLDLLGIYERADDLPVTFSRGLKQKAAIALAFIRPFDLLLVDEPFVGLDAAGKDALLELLADANGRGAALVVATHELAYVDRVARCVALRDGGLAYDGPSAGVDVLSLVS
jgi:ABC-2 type transport system ATP-binding protein